MVGVERPELRSPLRPPLGELMAPLLKDPPIFQLGQMNGSGVFIEANDIPDFMDEGNRIGFNNEQRVGRLISRFGFVREVRQVEHSEGLNGQLVDLVVTTEDGFSIPEVLVQVKSKRGGVDYFFKELAKRIEGLDPEGNASEDEKYRRKREWMAEKGLIVINAGKIYGQPATDDYILDKFQRDLAIMIAYRDRLQTYKAQASSYIQGISGIG